MKNSTKSLIMIVIGVGLCGVIFSVSLLTSTIRKTEYTVEVYDIFEVVHSEKNGDPWTFVYTYGQCQFFFRGDLDINASSSYVFTYVKNGRRWRDLTMISYREFTPLTRTG